MSDPDPMDLLQVEADIHALDEALTQNTRLVTQLTKRRAAAKRAYRIAHSKAYLHSGGAIPERKARADLETEAELDELELSRALVEAAQTDGRNIRERLEGLRTIAANLRDRQWHPHGRGG